MKLFMRMYLSAITAASLAVIACPAPVRAEPVDVESRYSKGFHDCPGFNGSTMEMIGCIDAEHDIQDKKLNETYKKIMTDLNDGQKAKLKDAQRAWITYRDSWCAAQQDDAWGSLSTIAAASCVLDETIRRTMELEHYPPET